MPQGPQLMRTLCWIQPSAGGRHPLSQLPV